MAEKLLDDDFLHRLERLSLVSRRIFRGRLRGERRSRRRGQSAEFADYRNYVEGDDLRHIDWNIYGRLDRLFLKLFLEEEDLHVHILLDASLSMGLGSPRKLTYAKRVAAAIAYVGLENQDRVQVHAFNHGLAATTGALRGRRQRRALFDFFDRLAPSGATRLLDVARLFTQATTHGKGVVVLLSDLLDPGGFEPALKRILAHGYETYVVHLLSPEEMRPDRADDLRGDLRLVDIESGDTREVTVGAPLLARYRAALARFCGGAEEFCLRHGAAYVFGVTDQPFDQLVLTALRQGGLFR